MTRPIPQIITELKADAGVSTLSSGRVYADNPPQDDTLPIVVITLQSTQAYATVDNCGSTKVYNSRITVDIVCETRGQSEELQEAVEDALVSFSSADSTHRIEGVNADSGASWQIIEPIDGSDERGYWCTQDFMINYRRI